MPRKEYVYDERIDRIIRESYASGGYGGLKLAIEKVGYPRHAIYRRANLLGLTCMRKVDKTKWTQDEIDILKRNAHKQALTIQRILRRSGFERTANAIDVKRRDLNLSIKCRREDHGIYTTNRLAECFGCAPSVILRWIRLGLLNATKAGTQRVENQNGDFWEIKEMSVRSFLIKHTAHVDHTKCDKYWLFDILSNSSYAKGGVYD